MNEQTNTNTSPMSTTGDTIWINIWRDRVTGEEYRGIYNFTSPEAASSTARQYLADNPNSQFDYVGVMPRDEWELK